MLVGIVTPLFPRPDDPHSGWFVHQTVEALKQYVDLKVICPQPSYQKNSDRVDKAWEENRPSVTPIRFAFPAVRLLTRPFNGASCARKLYPILKDLHPDLILNYWLYPEGYAAVQCGRRLKIPVIVGSLGSDLRRIPDALTRRMVAKTVRGADFVIAVSEELRQRALQMGVNPANSRSILNGCDARYFHHGDQLDARRELQVPVDAEVILYVGRFDPAKGLMELCTAFAALARERPLARLVLIGFGPFEATMMSYLREKGVADRVDWKGRLVSRQVAEWMRAASLFCLPSYSEGCPNVVVEAVSCGCPVVATSVGGIPELVDTDCGILVPAQDCDALLGALRAGLTRTWDRRTIAAQNQRTWDDVARDTVEVCRQVHAPSETVALKTV